jgi:hypothetical protein
MKVTRLVKEYKDKHCPLCAESMKNHWTMHVTIPLEVAICTDCAYERKEFLGWLQDNLPAHIGDIKTLGIPHIPEMVVAAPARGLHCAYVNK